MPFHPLATPHSNVEIIHGNRLEVKLCIILKFSALITTPPPLMPQGIQGHENHRLA